MQQKFVLFTLLFFALHTYAQKPLLHLEGNVNHDTVLYVNFNDSSLTPLTGSGWDFEASIGNCPAGTAIQPVCDSPAILEHTFTTSKITAISFDLLWQAYTDNEFFFFIVDGDTIYKEGQNATAILCERRSFAIPAGNHTVKWQMTCGSSGNKSLDNILIQNREAIVQIQDGSEGNGKILVSDDFGQGRWEDPTTILSQNKYNPLDFSNDYSVIPCPASSQTYILNSSMGLTDTCGILYDSGGDNAGFGNNENHQLVIYESGHVFTRVIVHSIDLGAFNGDSLFINDRLFTTDIASPSVFIFAGDVLIKFISDGPYLFSGGTGFHITWDRINYSGSDNELTSIAGFFFDPEKGSVGGGVESDNAWGKVGDRALLMGYGSEAEGYQSTALGCKNNADGPRSIAVGSNNNADGSFCIAVGSNNRAADDFSTALGYRNTSGNNCTAMGQSNSALNIGSTATGRFNEAMGFHSIAMGENNSAIGYISTAIGRQNVATGAFSTAIGVSCRSTVYGCMAVGRYNIEPVGSDTQWVATDPAFVIGNGESFSNRSTALTILKNGNTGIGHSFPIFKLDVNGSLRTNGQAYKPGGGMWANISDRRLKQNIQPYTAGLSHLLQIRPVTYQYNALSGHNTKEEHVGIIAQELQTIAPDMVSENADGYLSVDNSAMVFMLVNAVKELNDKLEKVEMENQELKERIRNLGKE